MKAFARGLLGALAVLALLLIGLFFSMPAHAQLRLADGTVNTECAATPRDVPLPVPAKTIPSQAEMPAQLKGNGTQAIVRFSAKGVAAGWWVPRTGGLQPALYLYATTWAYLYDRPDLMLRLTALAIMPGQDSATAAAIGAAYDPTLHVLDMCDVWAPLVAPLNASKPDPAAPPPVAQYVATATTLYPLVNGVRGQALVSPKATLGQACDCSVTVPNPYGGRYCAVTVPNVSSTVVAGCSLKK